MLTYSHKKLWKISGTTCITACEVTCKFLDHFATLMIYTLDTLCLWPFSNWRCNHSPLVPTMYWWLSVRLQHHQCVSNGDTIVLCISHWYIVPNDNNGFEFWMYVSTNFLKSEIHVFLSFFLFQLWISEDGPHPRKQHINVWSGT